MDTQPTTVAATRIHGFLEREPVVWLSTVRPDGGPHLVPIWFWWDGEAMLVFSKPDAQKVRNLRANPSVMLALGDAEADFDVGLLEGRAVLLDRPTSDVLPAGHLAKYAARLRAIGVTPEAYAETYSQVIRIVPADFLAWHGRTTPRSARLAGAPSVSIDERRPEADGEPMSRRRSLPQPRVVGLKRVPPLRPRWPGETLVRGLRGLTGALADGLGERRTLPVGSL
jgi:PPOX class probable F420-dependent enzyme